MSFPILAVDIIDPGLLKTLGDIGAVAIMAIVLLLIVRIIGQLVNAFIASLDKYVAAIRESNEQTRLMREAITGMDTRHIELMVGTNSITHSIYQEVQDTAHNLAAQADRVVGTINDVDAKSILRGQRLLNEVLIVKAMIDLICKSLMLNVPLKEISSESVESVPNPQPPADELPGNPAG